VPTVVARRDEILELAGQLFAERGYATTTVREIADAAGILSGSLYHHFDSKESMVDELLSAYLREMVDAYRAIIDAGDAPLATLVELIELAFASIGTHRTAVAIMLNEFAQLAAQERFAYLRATADEAERLWVGVLRDGQRQGVLRSDVDPRLVYRFIRDAVWLTVRWYRPAGKQSTRQIADDYLKVLLEGIAVPKRRRT
jgi:AcrR family transcriptional regulator